MLYLDYSATTPVNEEVLNSFVKTTKDFIGNPNSLHELGVKAKQLEEKASMQIADILKVKKNEIIYTSGASEANNMAIKGIAFKYQNRGKHIITTKLEHSSVNAVMDFLKEQGFEIEYVETDNYGLVRLEYLKKIIRDDTILVCLNAVNSETGVRQNIEEIGAYLSKTKTFFHVDATQLIGKDYLDLTNIDTLSSSAHKFYGLKGIGFLIKKNNVELTPLIHGGKSTTDFRSGTPALPLIVSMAKALRLAYTNLDEKRKKVTELNQYLKDHLEKYPQVMINSNKYSIPYILNISLLNCKPETLQHALEQKQIYISTGSACSSKVNINQAILEVTKSTIQASHGVRISISHLTSLEDIKYFLKTFDEIYNKMEWINE